MSVVWLLQSDSKVEVTSALIDTISRMTTPNACTFAFATYANPVSQFMFECVPCQQTVCAVCWVRASLSCVSTH